MNTRTFEAKRFVSIDDYLVIVAWMKECGNTFALANEVEFRTPLMLLPTNKGLSVAHPGDWIVHCGSGIFVALPSKATLDDVYWNLPALYTAGATDDIATLPDQKAIFNRVK